MNATRLACAKRQSGFTLLELMITVVIIGILASIAVPSYTEYLLRAKLLEAFNGLSDGRIKMEQFFQDNRRYAATADGTTCPKKITDNISSGLKYFTIDCKATNETYDFTATGISGSPTDGFVYTINEENLKTTTGTSKKWDKTSTSCWIATASGSCY